MAKKNSSRKPASYSQPPPEPYRRVKVEKLLLDPNNPRLAEYGITPGALQETLLQSLWSKMAVEELVMSIAYNGYFVHEPLFVEVGPKDRYTVIEGNRRLAAVMLLLDEQLREKVRATDVPRINSKRRAEISTLPCVVATRQKLWRYLGFKHINGPASWSSYAKAQYIATVHNDYRVPLANIAEQIGDTHSTVERQYRGLMVIEQAEYAGVFDRNDSFRKFGFSHIYTGLDKPGIQKFLGIENKRRDLRRPVPKKKLGNLRELCEWLYGSRSGEIEPRMRSQNPDLKTLDAVLLSKKGQQGLRDGLPLSVAHDITLGDQRLFRGALQQAKQSLQKAHGTMSTGFEPNDRDALALAAEIDQLAVDLREEMNRKRSSRRRKKSAR